MPVKSGGIPREMDPPVPEGICALGLCIPEQTINLAVMTAFGLAGLLVLVGLAYIQDGHEALRGERKETVAEQRAFREFATRVGQLQPRSTEHGCQAVPGGGSLQAKGPPTSLVPSPPDGQLDAVRDSYRETVMAVPHYETEYGESLETNMAAELSPDLATAVTDGASALTPQLQQALVAQSVAAAEQRDDLQALIDAEATALDELDDHLTDLEGTIAHLESASFASWSWDHLQAAFEEVRGVQDRIDDLVAQRQEDIRTTPTPSGVDWTDTREFLYRSLDISHPVLADATALHERATALEDAIVGGILHQ